MSNLMWIFYLSPFFIFYFFSLSFSLSFIRFFYLSKLESVENGFLLMEIVGISLDCVFGNWYRITRLEYSGNIVWRFFYLLRLINNKDLGREKNHPPVKYIFFLSCANLEYRKHWKISLKILRITTCNLVSREKEDT